MLRKANDAIYATTRIMAILMFIGMVVLCMVQVFCRYVLKVSLSFTEELARFLFIWVTFLGTAMACRKNQHVRMELFLDSIPVKVARILKVFGTIASVLVYLIMIGSGVVVISKTMSQTSAALNLPMGVVYAAVPVCGFLMLVFMMEGSLKRKSSGIGGGDL